MTEDEIKLQLRRPAIKLTAGGFRPSNQTEESWFGKVFPFGPGESPPITSSGEKMLPFAQFYLPALSTSLPALANTKLITLFMSSEFPEHFEKMGDNWLIREYPSLEGLERKDFIPGHSYLKPFPLKAETVDEDYPLWDGGGVEFELESHIVALENEGKIRNYYDFTSHSYGHKFGGLP